MCQYYRLVIKKKTIFRVGSQKEMKNKRRAYRLYCPTEGRGKENESK